MKNENDVLTVGIFKELLKELLAPEFGMIHKEFAKIHARLEQHDTEFARLHREVGNLRDDVVDVLDRAIVPQLEDHRRDIALLKRAVTVG